MKNDLEIEKQCQILSIDNITKKLNLSETEYEVCGKYKAKLELNLLNKNKKDSKLILVTSINPTPYGEGKTTVSIGLNDALCKLGKKSIVVLREPSLGPVFGLKGGATGGGYSQVVPSLDINLHFTGDFHAVTASNNLLCAAIDNHIYHGNKLNIDINRIMFNRCIDINDRSLRNINIDYSGINRKEKFNITAASEIMAILCLATNVSDLKDRLNKILVAYNTNGDPVFAYQLKCVDSLMILLKDAIKPNLVQTLENNPAIIHGGPFANIAHGCNSLIATKIALNLSDYVVTEAGFGADLGAEKFFDIKCRTGNLKPNIVIINVTIRSIKHNGNGSLNEGIKILGVHIENMRLFLNNIIVCINQFKDDTNDEISFIKKYCREQNIECISINPYVDGSAGALELAKEVIKIENNECGFKFLYDLNESTENKIEKICKKIYRANNVIFKDDVKKSLKEIDKHFKKLPICIAKTPYSLSNNPEYIGVISNFDVTVNDIKVNSGAKFIIVYLSNVLTLPGLSENANLYNIKVDENFSVEGFK